MTHAIEILTGVVVSRLAWCGVSATYAQQNAGIPGM